jgi:aspartyl protease family protein
VNGTPVDFVVDTGATDMVLSREDAARIGLDPGDLAYTGIASTANGQVRTARVRLDEVSLGGITDRGVTASVNAGEMSGSLLGMSYLHRFERIEIANGRLILER